MREGGYRGVVGDDQDRAAPPVEVLQDAQDAASGLQVQRAGGLVAQQQRGVLGDGAGDGDALLLAARQLRREVAARSASPTAASAARDRSRSPRPVSSATSRTFSSAVSDGTRLKNWKTNPTVSRR